MGVIPLYFPRPKVYRKSVVFMDGGGATLREIPNRRPPFSFCVAHAPTKWHFCFEERFSRLSAVEPFQPRPTPTNDKNGEKFHAEPLAVPYFQSLSMSSNALSNASFIPFYIILITSFSKIDCFRFFFFSLSFRLVLSILISPSSHLKSSHSILPLPLGGLRNFVSSSGVRRLKSD